MFFSLIFFVGIPVRDCHSCLSEVVANDTNLFFVQINLKSHFRVISRLSSGFLVIFKFFSKIIQMLISLFRYFAAPISREIYLFLQYSWNQDAFFFFCILLINKLRKNLSEQNFEFLPQNFLKISPNPSKSKKSFFSIREGSKNFRGKKSNFRSRRFFKNQN